jgi:hypothetical protein
MEPNVTMLRLGLTDIMAHITVFNKFGEQLGDDDRLPISGFVIHLTSIGEKEYAGTVTIDLSGHATAEFGKKHKIFKLKSEHIFNACQWCWDKYMAQKLKEAKKTG